MMAQQPDEALMRILSFTPYDLNDNRQGMMSTRQRTGLIKVNEYSIVGLILLFPLVFVSWLIGIVDIAAVLGFAALIVLLGISNRGIVKKLYDIARGQIQHVDGITSIQISTTEQRTFLGPIRTQWAYGVVEGVSFYVPAEMAQSFQGKKLTVYYTPHFRQAVSAEFIE